MIRQYSTDYVVASEITFIAIGNKLSIRVPIHHGDSQPSKTTVSIVTDKIVQMIIVLHNSQDRIISPDLLKIALKFTDGSIGYLNLRFGFITGVTIDMYDGFILYSQKLYNKSHTDTNTISSRYMVTKNTQNGIITKSMYKSFTYSSQTPTTAPAYPNYFLPRHLKQ